jgi:hypothetical protein
MKAIINIILVIILVISNLNDFAGKPKMAPDVTAVASIGRHLCSWL